MNTLKHLILIGLIAWYLFDLLTRLADYQRYARIRRAEQDGIDDFGTLIDEL